MAKRFFVWADANCNGENIEWIELDGKGFKDFLLNPANRKRKIIKLSDPYLHECDDIYIEATKEQFKEWDKEYKHSLYVNRNNRKFTTISIQEYQEENPEFDIEYIDTEIETCLELNVQNFVDAINSTNGVIKEILTIRLESFITGVSQIDLIKKHSISQYKYYHNLDLALEILKSRIFS